MKNEFYHNSMVNSSHYCQGQNYMKSENTDTINPNFVTKNFLEKQALQNGLNKILDGGLDSEKLTIIALIIILAKEGADMKLILALGYILI